MNMLMTPEERSEITRFMRLPRLKQVRFAWGLRNDRRVSNTMLMPLAGAVAFIILPVHVLPPFVPFRRRLENATALAIGLLAFVKLAPPGLLADHLSAAENGRSD